MKLVPGTYPSMKIQEGCRGPDDPALKKWDSVFGKRCCGLCAKFPGAGGSCKRRDNVEAEDQACIKDFERKDET